jgi:hypothetical protein
MLVACGLLMNLRTISRRWRKSLSARGLGYLAASDICGPD